HQDDDLEFVECFVDTPLEICEQRDIKGLYKKARAGEVKKFTGVNQNYEVPENPELVLKAGSESIEHCVQKVIDLLVRKVGLPFIFAFSADDHYSQNIISLDTIADVHELFIEEKDQDKEKARAKQLPSID